LAGPSVANGAVSCSFGSGTLNVAMSQAGDTAELSVSFSTPQGNPILVTGPGCSGAAPTTTNTDTINVTDSSGGATTVKISRPEAFGPGATAESIDFLSEIEINVNLGGNDGDEVALDQVHKVIVDSAGVDTNYGVEPPNDTDNDIFLTGVGALSVDLGFGDDFLSGQGRGSAVGSTPTDIPLLVQGEAEPGFREQYDDTIIGGDNDDNLFGGLGSDTIDGGLGDDVLDWGQEFFQDDRDTLSYGTAPSGVTVDLTTIGQQDTGGAGEDAVFPQFQNLTGGFNNLRGSSFGDVLTGDNGPNRITGSAGVDTMFGLSGIDKLNAKDGTKDTRIDCGPGKNRKESAKVDGKDPRPRSC
jgi:hypothetical protein